MTTQTTADLPLSAAPAASNAPVRARSDEWTPEIEAALIIVARCGGSCEMAAPAAGRASSTLYDWKTRRFPELYERVREQVAPQLEKQAVEQARRIMDVAARKELELLEAIDVNRLEPRDIPTALRNVSTTKALQADKVILPLTGRPSSYTQPAGLKELMAQLAQVAPELVRAPKHVDSTAIEDPSTAQTTAPPPSSPVSTGS